MIFRRLASLTAALPAAAHSRKGAGSEKTRRKLFLEGLERRDLLAGVTTDKLDYHPAETALISATGYEAGETVRFQVLHTDGTPNTGNGHDAWFVKDGSAADLDGRRDGNVETNWYVDPDDSLGATFELSALGLSSGASAVHTFTDSALPSGTLTTNVRSGALADVTSASFSHTVPAGDNRILLVSVTLEGNEEVSAVSFNGQALTRQIRQTSGATDNDSAVEIWYLVAPSVGTFNVNVTFTSGTSPFGITAANYTGVDQFLPFGASSGASAASGNPSVTLTTFSPDSLLFGAASKDNEVSTFTPGSGVAESWDIATGANAQDLRSWGGTRAAAAPGSFTLNATASDSTGDWAMAAVELRAAGLANPPFPAQACDLDIVLVLDVSGSIDATEYDQIVAAASAFVNAFDPQLESEFGLVAFNSNGVVVQGFTDNGSLIIDALTPRPNPGDQFTNWDIGLFLARNMFTAQNALPGRAAIPDLIVFASDGNPNRLGGHTGVTGHPAAVTDPATDIQAIAAGVDEANLAKAAGIRVVAVGVGSDVNVSSLHAISGPNLAPPFNVNTDVVSADFPNLDQALIDLADGLCPKKGTIAWEKRTDVSPFPLQGGATFTVTPDPTGAGAFLTVVDNGPLDANPALGQFLVNDVPKGDYTITETVAPAGFNLDNDPTRLITVTLADMNAVVGVQGVDNPGDTDESDFHNPVTPNPALNIVKDATVAGGTANVAGELITYAISVQNTGNQTLTGVTVVDSFVSNLTRIGDLVGDNDALLEVGETWRYTASHAVTQAEIDAGTNIVNVATADSNETPADSDDATIPVTQTPALNIVKDATVPGGTANVAGELITYAISVQNTGNQTLTGVTVVDPFVSNLTRIADLVGDNDALLEVGETWRFTASHAVTQAEIDAGTNIVNVATADSSQTGPDTDDASIPVAQSPGLNIVKDATVAGGTANVAGEVISYSINVQNTGNLTLTGVTVVDAFVSNLTRITDLVGDNDALLEVGETWRYTASHTVTQAEIDAGTNIVNIATADSNQTPPDSDDATVPVTQTPSLNILKDASVPGGTADITGEVISYSISVQNTGNQTLTGVTVVDPFVSNLTRITDLVGDNDNLLEVGETWSYTASHTVTQAEIDAGTNIVNVATADSNQTPPDSDDAIVPVAQGAALNIVKDASVPGGTADAAGEIITYAISVQNTGNQTLTGVTVVDAFVSNLTRITDLVGDNDALLEVGETWRYTASHIVTQAEIDAGANIVNVATADSNETPADSDDATIPVTQTPALNIVKDATVPGNTANFAGEVISYAISVQNTGNQTLTGVTVVDPFVSNLTRIADLVGDNDNLLEVGETWRYTASHVVTQAEIDAGANIVNVATADSNQTPPDSDDATVPVTQTPALNIVKDAAIAGGTADIAGEVITYAISVQNTGNQTLTGVTVVDPFVSNLTRIADLVGDNDNLLEVGETWRYTASHIVAQSEINAGANIVNVATADSNETPSDSDDATIPVTQSPSLNIVKDASVPGGTADIAGEIISYTISVQNTGNQTLTGVTVVDPFVNNLTRVADLVGDSDNLLEVGETWQYTASHVVTQAEMNAGANIVNIATADSNETPPDSDDAAVPVTQSPALTLVKLTNGQDANAAPGPVLQVGSTATFTYLVSNTGNVTFSNVVLIDDDGTPGNPADDFHPTFTGGDVNGNGLLDAGETWSYTASHIVTAGQYTNLGTVTASTLGGTTASVSDPSSHFGRSQIIVVTADKGNQSLPFVHIVDASTGEVTTRFLAYELGYRGGVRVATGDINGDGIDEIITVPGRSLAPRIKVFDQQGNLLHSFMAFPGSFKGGVDVAVGDINGDGKNDIVASMTYNGSQVKVFRNVSTGSSIGFTTFTTFNPFGTFKGGSTVEVASLGTASKAGGKVKLNNVVDARSEIIVASGSGMRSTVKVFAFTGSSKTPAAVRTFLPLGAGFKGGITMDVARVNGDAVPDIIVAAGNGGSSQVRVLNGINGAILSGFNAYNDGSRNAPVHVAAADETGDGLADYIFTAQGTDGATRKVRKFEALTATLVDEVMESHADFGGAYFLETLLSQSQISS